MIRKILKKLFSRFKEGLRDRVTFRDTLKITMRREDGSIYREWEEHHNTWVTYGKQQVRAALADGGFTKIGYMYCTASAGASEQTTTNTKPADDKARFVSTWPSSGEITSITKFSIRQASAGSNLAEITVAAFDKPDGISLEITWETTVS